MKKKIILGLAIFALMFFFGGVYIVTTMETTIFDLHRLSQLHRTVAQRKELLQLIKNNQNNVKLRGTHFTIEDGPDENGLVATAKRCSACHHAPASPETLAELQTEIEAYHELTREVFAARPGSAVSEAKAGAALQSGDLLVKKMERIIAITGDNLDRQEREILQRMNQRKITLFMLVTVGPFFAVGLVFVLINGLTRSVSSLLDATRRLKAGDLDHRIRGLYDEFGEVASSFNEMAASLKKQMQEMQRTEQMRVCGEMAAGLAHEIRNPLAGMKVSIEVLLAELDLEERDREVLVKVIEQIRNIELLIKNLLNYARPVAAQPVSFSVNRVLEKAAYFIEKHPSFRSGNPSKKMIKAFDEQLPEVIGDPQQLQQVFLNLLLNATDAIADGGEITVGTRQNEKDRSVAVEVHNTGKGIPADIMEKIFQPFFTTKGKGKGTGLGLAVSKRIVEEHGGSIEVANAIAGGVTVAIVLPITPEGNGAAI